MNNQSLISVIVPVYNTEQHLPRCIDSILSQTFADFELLLIDDGSKDSSGKICDEYATKDSRVRVFHKENGGVSSARNFALNIANSPWIAMVDSDDYVKNNYLKDLYNEITEYDADFVIQDFEFIKESGKIIEKWYNPIKRVYGNENIAMLLKEQSLDSRGCTVGMLFSKEIIVNNKISYPLNVRFGEDSCFLFRYLKYATKIACSDNANYCYIDHPTSAIHKKHNFKIEFNGYKHIKEAVFALRDKYGIEDELKEDVFPWVAHFTHRAITVIQHKAELNSFTEDDWSFFNQYFKAISRKTRIDKWIFTHLHEVPIIILPYLKFNRSLRRFLVKNNLWNLLDKLKE